MKRLLGAIIICTAALPLASQPRDPGAARQHLFTVDSALAALYSASSIDSTLWLFVSRIRVGAPILIPDSPIVSRADGMPMPSAPGLPNATLDLFRARYGGAGAHFSWTPQHAVVNSTGDFGCTVGITRVQNAADAGKPRFGRYITCWTLTGTLWRSVAHSRNGETALIPEPGATLESAPHSATPAGGARAGNSLKAIQDADAAFAKLASDSSPALAFPRYATADAMLLGGAPKPRRGPTEIGAAFASFPASGNFTWAPVRSYGYAAGGLGFTVGEATILQDGATSKTKYLTVWREEPDGGWKFIYDLGSSRP